jgi:carbamate kinase
LLRSERASDQVPRQPLDVCGAASQGEIGYLLSRSLKDELACQHLSVPIVSIMTQTIVSANDPAMSHPTKPIGPFYSRAEAERRREAEGWSIVEDAARGYRRVVPSPEPLEIVELEVIREMVANGVLVIAAGGGGIPVVACADGRLQGIEAVIDKDRASALLASELGVDLFVISTDENFVYLDYKKPTQRPLRTVAVDELQTYLRAGQFPPGNMGPKVESALRFLGAGGKEAIITSYPHLCAAVAGSEGTHILPDSRLRETHQELEMRVAR